MTTARTILQIILIITFGSCVEKPNSEIVKLYFDKDELSDDFWSDSLDNKYFSEKLMSLNEPSLKDTTNKIETLRLTVFASFYNAYCIKLEKIDSLYRINFKMSPDRKSFRKTGHNGLTLLYESDFGRMDTIYRELRDNLERLDIYRQNNLTPEIVVQKRIVGADGTTYLLEYYANRRHVALVRWNGFLHEKFYDNSSEFVELVDALHQLVPPGLIADIDKVEKIEDFRFPVFKEQ